ECAVHDPAHVLRIEALRHRRKPTDIEEEHSRLFAFAPDGHYCSARAAELLLGSHGLPTEAAPGSDSRLWRVCEPSGRGYRCHRQASIASNMPRVKLRKTAGNCCLRQADCPN